MGVAQFLPEPPVVGELQVTIRESGDLRAREGSIPSTAVSLPLIGTFGNAPGPGFVSVVASDPDGGDAVVSAGDIITVTFDTQTNQPFGPTLDRGDLEALFTFSQVLTTDPVGITGVWVDDVTLVITITSAASQTIPTVDDDGVDDGELRLTVKLEGNLKDILEKTLASTAVSSLLTGNFGERVGPQILSLVAGDPSPTEQNYSVGDTITVTFDEGTNRPTAATKQDIDDIFDFKGISLGGVSVCCILQIPVFSICVLIVNLYSMDFCP